MATAEALHEAMLGYSRLRRDRVCFASQTTLARDVGCSRRTVIRHQQKLEAAGVIVRLGTRRIGRCRPTVVWRVSHNAYGKGLSRTAKACRRPFSGRSSGCSGRKRLSRKKGQQMKAGQQLTAHFVDECVEQGKPAMVRMKGHVAKRAYELYRIEVEDMGYTEQAALEDVKQALTEFVRREGKTPLQIAEIAVELERTGGPEPQERLEGKRRAKAWIDEHGWPTGAKFVRGTHSGSYKYDPLGTDRVVEHDWPHQKPSFEEIVRALS